MAIVIDIKDAQNEAKKQVMTELLTSLSPREERCLRMRFGIGINKSQTIEEISLVFNVEADRIQQVIAKALQKMQHPSRIKKLQAIGYETFLDFMNDYLQLTGTDNQNKQIN